MITCNRCGTTMPDESRFCKKCGSAMDTPEYYKKTLADKLVEKFPFLNNICFTFMNPVLNFFDSGKFFRQPFCVAYYFFALVSIAIPIYFIYHASDNHFYEEATFPALVITLILLFAGWAGMLYWVKRAQKVLTLTTPKDDYVAIPVIAHFLKSLGEFLGLYVASVLELVYFFGLVFASKHDFQRVLPLILDGKQVILLFLIFPVVGFFIVAFFRIISELISALAAIANNTKKH